MRRRGRAGAACARNVCARAHVICAGKIGVRKVQLSCGQENVEQHDENEDGEHARRVVGEEGVEERVSVGKVGQARQAAAAQRIAKGVKEAQVTLPRARTLALALALTPPSPSCHPHPDPNPDP